MVQSPGLDRLSLQTYDPIYPCTPDPEGNPPDPADAEICGYVGNVRHKQFASLV